MTNTRKNYRAYKLFGKIYEEWVDDNGNTHFNNVADGIEFISEKNGVEKYRYTVNGSIVEIEEA